MTTSVVFSSASNDGYISSNNATTATMYAGSGLAADTASTTALWGYERKVGVHWGYQPFFEFDTSVIPADAVITAASFNVWITAESHSYQEQVAQVRLFDYGTSITTADWRTGGAAGQFQALTLLHHTIGAASTGGYHTGFSNDAFQSNVTKGGLTRVMGWNTLANSSGSSATDNTGAFWTISTADNTGTTQDPKLTITWTTTKRAFAVVVV